MDLFEMMEEPQEEVQVHPVISKDIKDEYRIIIQKYGIKAPEALLDELASIWSDPPPLSPWAK